jgi:hypothetical protein
MESAVFGLSRKGLGKGQVPGCGKGWRKGLGVLIMVVDLGGDYLSDFYFLTSVISGSDQLFPQPDARSPLRSLFHVCMKALLLSWGGTRKESDGLFSLSPLLSSAPLPATISLPVRLAPSRDRGKQTNWAMLDPDFKISWSVVLPKALGVGG